MAFKQGSKRSFEWPTFRMETCPGPIPFIIHINDIDLLCGQISELNKFDDTKLAQKMLN